MLTTRTRWTATLALTIAAMLVSGCGGGDDDPGPRTTSSPAASPTESATPEPPELPEAAKVLDRPGAEAFVRHYFDLVNYANATGDPAPMLAVSTTECVNCTSVADQAAALQDGERLEGGGITVVHTVAAPIEDDLALVSTLITQEPGQVLRADGAVDREFSGDERLALDFYVVVEGARWMTFGFAETAGS